MEGVAALFVTLRAVDGFVCGRDGVHCEECCGVVGKLWAIVFGRAFVHVAMAMANLAMSKMLARYSDESLV